MKDNEMMLEQQVKCRDFEEEITVAAEATAENEFEANDVDVDGADDETASLSAFRLSSRGRRKCRSKDSATVAVSEDSIRMYLKEIGAVPLLTAAEEVDLAIKYEAGVKATAKLEAAAAGEIELTARDYRRLRRIEQVGCDAKQQLIVSNLRLVVSIAKRYKGHGMTLLDLVQEGNLGLIHAIEKYDYTKGFKLSTYATHWIRQSISRALADQGRTIRLPVHVVETLNKLARIESSLEQDLGRDPSDEEVAEAMGITTARLCELRTIRVEPTSLETPIGDQEDSQLGDFIPDCEATDPEALAEDAAVQKAVAELLSSLSEREARILELRYGLKGSRPHTLEDTGHLFNVTRERIRQIENKALAKLRHPNRSAALREYLEE
ncbi:MAG: sigma-70 family RNA polymerase sigma factor [Coriobacteriia bacterium]|nr:sigma-70 family RNA polymerase sigma factor [Coriobacteriia bacterium]